MIFMSARFIEVTKKQLDRLTKNDLVRVENGIIMAKINPHSDPVPVKLEGTPDPHIEYKTGLSQQFHESAAIVRACREKALSKNKPAYPMDNR
jgi:hypothetical protein